MTGTTKLNLVLLALSALWSPHGSDTAKPDSRLDRSYQLAPIPVINGIQGVQYVPMAALYSELPAVLVPKQLGMDMMALHSTPATSVALPPQGVLHQKLYETSTPLYPSSEEFRSVQEPVLQPVRNTAYGYRKTKTPVYAVKRPAYYNFGRKKLTGHSAFQNQKVSSISIEPSIDISDQLQQLQSSYPSTTPSPASTYGPAKVLEHSAMPHVTTYVRTKGHHSHPHYHPKDYRVYSHMHKGHVHNHFIPPGYPMHKSQYHSSAKPAYPILKPTPATYSSQGYHTPEQSFNYHSYARPETFSTNHIRFPEGELKKSLLSAYKNHQEEILSSTRFGQPLKTHSDLTQAIVKDSGTINNYDASIPLKIPSKKPNQFEVKEILRNADVHFIDGTLGEPIEYQPQVVQYSPYHNFDQGQYQQLTLGQVPKDNPLITGYSHGISNNHIDYYDQRDASSYAHAQSVPEELSTSETLKVPVAVIKGTHGLAGQGAFSVKAQKAEQGKLEKAKQKAFTPSSTNSDWIPMSGKPLVSPVGGAESSSSSLSSSASSAVGSSYGDKYFAELLNKRAEEQRSEPPRIITSNRNIGDIISGKIPGEYSPFKQSGAGVRAIDGGGDIITGKIPFGQDPSEMDRRKGSVIDGSSDTSNLVVSSMIKFS